MNSLWQFVIPLAVIAMILWLACKAIIGTYFKAKGGFVDQLVEKLKGTSNGKAE